MTGALPMRTRIAPTPSGYLHAGNLANFLLTSWWAQDHELEVALRIDDVDPERTRPAFIEDIFRCLDALKISWIAGPSSLNNFPSFSQQLQTEYFRGEIEAAQERGLVTYRCRCSRSSLAAAIPCNCLAHPPTRHEPATIRLDTSCLHEGDWNAEAGTVLWRRDDVPSYHVVSIVSDRDLGITHIMRGADLRSASTLQQALAPFFEAPLVETATIIHHDLAMTPTGEKLSKSSGRHSAPLSLDADGMQVIRVLAKGWGQEIGVNPFQA